MIHFSGSAICWLETILLERFGHRFMLTQQSNTLKFYLNGSQGYITFARLQSIFLSRVQIFRVSSGKHPARDLPYQSTTTYQPLP